jgi:hypothetical protein
MRTLMVAAALLLALPAMPFHATPPQVVSPVGAVPLSHEFFTPYMNAAALDIPYGIRPGAWLQIGLANCTASFVVRDPAGALYITTAGHCTSGPGQRASIKDGTLVGALNGIREFGTVAANWPLGFDAALIRIDPAEYANVNPTMTGWGGPTGMLTGTPSDPLVVRHYGWGWVTWYDFASRCRSGVADIASWDSNTWWYVSVGGGGDSGSAVMTADGLAMGILDWGGFAIPTVVTGAFVSLEEGGVRLDKTLAAFKVTTGLDLTLVTGEPVRDVCTPEPPLS